MLFLFYDDDETVRSPQLLHSPLSLVLSTTRAAKYSADLSPHALRYSKDRTNERRNSGWDARANAFGICRAIWSWQRHAGQSTHDQISRHIWIQRLEHNAPPEVHSSLE